MKYEINIPSSEIGVLRMINDQDKRAIETMARCGCEFDSLCSMFPKVPKEVIIAIWNYVVDAGRRMDDPEAGEISMNCS